MSTYSKEWHYEYCMGETECKHGDPECPHNHFLKDENVSVSLTKTQTIKPVSSVEYSQSQKSN